MKPKPIPELTKRQWDVLAQQLKKPATREMQEALEEAGRIARQVRPYE